MQACNFPGAISVGKPKDWNDELDGECGTIFCAVDQDLRTGLQIMYSVYKPTQADLDALNAGGALRLGIFCQAHPVFNMVVMSPETTTKAELEPKWDLGEPI